MDGVKELLQVKKGRTSFVTITTGNFRTEVPGGSSNQGRAALTTGVVRLIKRGLLNSHRLTTRARPQPIQLGGLGNGPGTARGFE